MSTSLRAIDLHKAFAGRPVVAGVSLTVAPGEVVGLLGPNGAGKSTAFGMVAGLLRPDAGEVWLAQQRLTSLPLHGRARFGLGYLPQYSTVFAGLSARDNLLAIAQYVKDDLSAAQKAAAVDALLADYQLSAVAHVPAGRLSGGQKRRLELARALIPKPRFLLLDEPFAGVDPIAVGELQGRIATLAAAGLGILLTDHNVRETLQICHRAYLINEGCILRSGTPAAIVADKQARQLYLGADFSLS